MSRHFWTILSLTVLAAVSRVNAASCESYILTGASPSSVLDLETINDILKEHNDARRAVSPWATVMPMLVWDQTLADHTQSYMDTCPHGSSLVHSTSSDRSNVGGFSYVGENLAAGTGSSYLPSAGGAASVAAWNNELSDYTYGTIGDSTTCVSGKACGHYTQNIWADTTKVGCAYKRCESLTYKNYWSCVYGSGGNYQTQYPYVSTTDASAVAECQITGLETPVPATTLVPTTPVSYSNTASSSSSGDNVSLTHSSERNAGEAHSSFSSSEIITPVLTTPTPLGSGDANQIPGAVSSSESVASGSVNSSSLSGTNVVNGSTASFSSSGATRGGPCAIAALMGLIVMMYIL